MVKSLGFLARRAPPAVHLFVVLLALAPAYHGVDLSQCIAPLGMESGAIPDTDINASSSFDTGNVGPHLARLKSENLGGAWCPKNQITKEAREWLEIDLHTIHLITATATQGRFGNGVGVEFAEYYLLEYWRPRLGKWVRYRDIKGEEDSVGGRIKAEDPVHWAQRGQHMDIFYSLRTARCVVGHTPEEHPQIDRAYIVKNVHVRNYCILFSVFGRKIKGEDRLSIIGRLADRWKTA